MVRLRRMPMAAGVDLSLRVDHRPRALIATYNEQYLHSALSYKTPRQFERDHDTSPGPPFLAA